MNLPSGGSGISDSEHVFKFPHAQKKHSSFSNPFFDIGAQLMPRNIKDLFKWCEHLYLNNTIVSQCVERVVRYPITNLQMDNDEEDLVDRYKEIFDNILKFRSFMGDVGIDLHSYGNSFVSVFFPFNRMLNCKKCKTEFPAKMAKDLKYKGDKFQAKCLRCGNRGSMEYKDRRSLDIRKINLLRWNPKNIDISYNPITGDHQYYYTIPADIVARVKGGDVDLVASLPRVFLDTIKKNNVIKLNADYVYHLKTTSLAGLNQEWGIPPTYKTFKLHYYNAILRKANEAIAQDYLMPIRVMFPDTRGMTDPALFLNMKQYKESALGMIKQHRQDPGDAYFLPMPIGYQAIGAEMKALSVTPEIKMANEEIMNALGFPQELFYGSLSVQAAPVALRLLENSLTSWIDGLNNITQWVLDKISTYFDMPRIEISWAKVTLVDDIERKQLLLQLIGAQKIADDTFLNALGTSSSQEIKKKFKQQQLEQEEQKKFEEKMKVIQEQDQEGQEAEGGETPEDVEQKAQQLAEKWLNMDYSSRKKEMAASAQEDPSLYAMAKVIMERLRRSSASDQQDANQAEQEGQQ